MDRLTPTQRPVGGRLAQRQGWYDLLFLHWEVPVEALSALVPSSLEIDTFEGRAFVGLVPFTMRGVRLAGWPAVPGTANFHETNVRTYVHREGRDPGVWFFSLDAASRLAVTVARALWHLPYFYAAMSLDRRADGEIAYATRRRDDGAHCTVAYTPKGAPRAATPGSLEHFLAERYLLYANAGEGDLYRGQVHHAPYPLEEAEVTAWSESLLARAGIDRPAGPPLAHYARGVEVEVFALERLSLGP
ncbi:MAG: DUF2071 domain-containing protein [Myxococcales bacterium]|nr:DUF2071 domain-containing protein [Myxococcales bacterium]